MQEIERAEVRSPKVWIENARIVFAKIAPDRSYTSAGLPQPNTIALIERELEAIGVERFKVRHSSQFRMNSRFSNIDLILI